MSQALALKDRLPAARFRAIRLRERVPISWELGAMETLPERRAPGGVAER